MKGNLTKGERIFRLLMGALLIVAFYLSPQVHKVIMWVVAIILVATGLVGYCALSRLMDRPKKKSKKRK